ncbi:acyl-CoA dehydrogenase family protein [Microlunatus soli]|uniref:acyl-CoA oxidase n=1 Tax=Microlunatus soli TaxID=630515 RepID=A0A1H1N1T7_9ACTN|nr:acyl-CoA dehydrogenase [Microlunatus soli]SDR92840.1 Acyl-coenzyme A oxidase [Microlunatus soli]
MDAEQSLEIDPNPIDPAAVAPAPIDVAELAHLLDGPYAAVRDQIRAHLPDHAELLEPQCRLDPDDYRRRVRQAVLDLAAAGDSVFGLPTAYGGGGDLGASIAAFETLAFGDLSVLVKTGVQFGLFGGAILQLGSTAHHDRFLADVVSGRLLGCFAMTERGHGSDVQSLRTTARYDADSGQFVINTPTDSAHKEFIGGAAVDARLAVVFAQLEVDGTAQGVHAFLVPLRDEHGRVLSGIRVEDDGHKIGLNGVDNGRIWFDSVSVPRAALLDRYGKVSEAGSYSSPIDNPDRRFFTMLGTLVQGRVSVAGAGVSSAKIALAIAIRYADRRRQFAPRGTTAETKLLDYGMHQRRLLPRLARTYALHCAQQALVAEYHDVFTRPDSADDHRRRALESRAAATKALSTWSAVDIIQACREACGGAGYLAENRFAALRADTDVFTTFEGDNHVLLQLVAKGLLTNYSSGFNDLDQLGLVRFVAGQAVETVIERTAVHSLVEQIKDVLPGSDREWDRQAGIRDRNYQLAMFRWREEHRIAGVARRLKRGVDDGMSPEDVFNRCQSHAINAAWAHGERLLLEAFADTVAAMPDGDNKITMALLCDLFALSTIETDRGWWMEHGRLSAPRAKAITREIDALLGRLRAVAVPLVDAFAVPPTALAEGLDNLAS